MCGTAKYEKSNCHGGNLVVGCFFLVECSLIRKLPKGQKIEIVKHTYQT